MKEIDLSIIVIFNNKEKLEKELLNSLNKQNVCSELILVDNSEGKFKSASSALNYGASQATKTFLMFVHQDIIFEDESSLEKLFTFLKNHPDSVIGVAGKRFNEKKVYSNIKQGAKKDIFINGQFNEFIRVDCLDECLMMCSKCLYNQIKFDEEVCDAWDLYVCDFCFSAGLRGISIFCVDSEIWHTSLGNPKHAFYKCLKRICKKYKGRLSIISTCCTYVRNNFWANFIIDLKELRNNLIKILR